MFETKATDEAQLAMAEEILAIDSRSRRALSIAGDIYRRRNVANPRDTANANKMIQAYTGLIAADPTNTRLVDDVTKAIAGAGNPGVALPIIRKAVEENPGDAALMRTQFLVELAARETKAALRTGTELAALDTAMADTSYFFRMAAAYQADSQPAKAAEEIAKGVAKFPENASLLVVSAQAQRAAGQTQQALETLKKALALDPNVEKGNLQMAQIYYTDMKKADSAYAALVLARKGADSTLVGDVALSFGNTAQRELKAESPELDYTNTINFLTFADANATSPERRQQAKFLIGAVSVKHGQALLKAGADTRNCPLVKQAKEQFVVAQVNVPAGGRFAPQAAGQLMQALAQLIPAAEQTEKAVCK
jgi:tetratricopeptide (TPR) repeat protein